MSWVIGTNKALALDNVDLSEIPDGLDEFAILYWLRCAAGSDPRSSIVDTATSPAAPYIRLLNTGTGEVQCFAVGSATVGFTTGHGAIPDDVWCWQLHEYNQDDDTLRSYLDNGSPGESASSVSFSVASWEAMEVSIGRDFDGNFSSPHKIAHWALCRRHLTSGERSDLAAGANPQTILGSDLLVYLHDDKNAVIGGTFVDVGGGAAITWDADDNPAVDEPGGGGPTITLAQIERGRVLARGLTRGLA